MQNSYKKSGVNISLANNLVRHIANVTKKNVKKTKKKKDFLQDFAPKKSQKR